MFNDHAINQREMTVDAAAQVSKEVRDVAVTVISKVEIENP